MNDKNGSGQTCDESSIVSAYKSLQKNLRYTIPLAGTSSLALFFGASTFEMFNYDLALTSAACVAMAILIFVYFGCYRAALMMEQLLKSGPTVRFTEIIRDNSIMNPFSSSCTDDSGRGPITDYVGLVAVHVPLVIMFVASIWVMSESKVQLNEARGLQRNDSATDELFTSLESEIIQKDEGILAYVIAIAELNTANRLEAFKHLQESRPSASAEMQAIQKYESIRKVENSVFARAMWANAFSILKVLFFWLYGAFLFRLFNIARITNRDWVERATVVVSSGAIIVLPIIVIDVVAQVRAFRALWCLLF